jgi:hypothetical protein
MTKINQIATEILAFESICYFTLNKEDCTNKINLTRLKPNEVLNLILEYSLLSGRSIEESLFIIRKYIL